MNTSVSNSNMKINLTFIFDKMTVVLGTLPDIAQKWALFDLDWTLIRPTTSPLRPTLSGGPFSLYEDDWTLIPQRIGRLLYFVREGYKVGIVTNQKYKGMRLTRAKNRLQRIYDLFKQYIPDIVIMAATDETTMASPQGRLQAQDPSSTYRKPGRGWGYHLRFLPGSLYVGDAVQDPTKPERSWGHSDDDRQFAQNLGLPFVYPEDVFPQLPLPAELFEIPKIVLILVGPPGSGKSTFARSHSDFIHLESDAYRSNWPQMKRALEQNLAQGNKIIVDATNPTRERRREIIQLSAQYGAPVGTILFLNSGKWAHRDGRGRPKQAYNMYWSRFEEPIPEEGAQIYYQT